MRNIFVVFFVLLITAKGWCAHLLTPRNCIPCLMAARMRNRVEDTYDDTILALENNDGEENTNIASNYLSDLSKVRELFGRKNLLEFDVIDDDEDDNDDDVVETSTSKQRHGHERRFKDCAFATLPIRHARAADAKDAQRRHLRLCHFKICNIGAKRNAAKFFITNHNHPDMDMSMEFQ